MVTEDGGDEQARGDTETPASLAERQAMLDYVAEISMELAGLLDRHQMTALADELKIIGARALKAKYEDPS